MTREEFDAIVNGIIAENTPMNTTAASSAIVSCDVTDDEVGITASDSIETNTARFSGAKWYEGINKLSISIVGCGGIGSWTALAISRFRPYAMSLYDADIVERVNLAGQCFNNESISRSKVAAIADILQNFSDVYVNTYQVMIDERTVLSPVTICGFDNMAARKMAFNAWYAKYKGNSQALFMDGRMSADTIQIYAMTGDDEYSCNQYIQNELFDDAEADATVCSLKQTTYVAMIMGGMMANKLVEFVQSKVGLPINFKTEYNSVNMTIKVQ